MQEEPATTEVSWRSQAGIPVRNLWLLLVYASDLAAFKDRFSSKPDDHAGLPDILARLLIAVVERRLRHNLSRGYRSQRSPVSRLRGRIDWLQTLSGMHLSQGRLVCRFEELTFNTPRNRLVRSALETIARRVTDSRLAGECRRLARDLSRLEVSGDQPSEQEISRDPIASHQSDDRLMIAAAKLAINMFLPSETEGDTKVTRLERDEVLLRKIFEKAVAGFYRHELNESEGWQVRSQPPIDWDAKAHSPNGLNLLPGMKPDIILERRSERRIVIDTKFTGVLTKGQYGADRFKSQNLYQLYAYLRSQAGRGNSVCDRAEGILLYPSLDRDVDETVDIQGHRIRFVTINLALRPNEILSGLRSILSDPL